MNQHIKDFYDKEYELDTYAHSINAQEHSFYKTLKPFIEKHQLHEKKCLEIGCGRGALQDVVPNYTGLDISDSVEKYFHKPFHQGSSTALPFKDNQFDVIWSYAVLEHVPNPEKALYEMRRVLKDEGFLLLAPAWQCRPWRAEGYPVRPYSDFNIKGKLIKASIPIRNSILFRSSYIFPRRIMRLGKFLMNPKAMKFLYRELEPNFEHFWMSDSDAVNSMDPFETILWFVSRGDECLSHPSWESKFFVRTGSLIFKVSGSSK